MTIKQRIISTFILFTLIVCMGFSFAYAIITLFRLTVSPIKVAGIIIACTIIYMGVFFNKQSIAITLLLTPLSLAIGILYLYTKGLLITFDLTKLYESIRDFGTWTMEFVQGKALENMHYSGILVVLICMLVILLVYVFTAKKFNFFIFFVIGTCFFIFQTMKQIPIQPLAFNFFILAALLYYFHAYYLKLQRTIEESEGVSQVSYMKLAGPLSLFIFLFTLICAHLTPLKFTALHSLLDVKREVKLYDHMDEFPYGKQLGGDITLTDTPMLEVIAPKPVYLKATTKSIYTGDNWANKKEEEINIFDTSKDKLEDTVESLRGNGLLIKEPTGELFDQYTLEIIFRNAQTKSVFMPAKSETIVFPDKIKNVYLKYGDLLYLNKPKKKGFTYEVRYYTPKYKSEKLEDALRKSKIGFYADYKIGQEAEENLDRFIERAELIQSDYTSLPDTLPQRVKDLATLITEDYKTNYDKVRAIEAYLAGNYTYTLTPGMPRENQDFVDEFLFEGKQGYCTYFATSMAVLTRCIGLPSRYVEGYTMPATPNSITGSYTITNKQSHAWVEVYFEGFGWVMFEPTASYQNSFRENVSTAMDTYYREPIKDTSFEEVDNLAEAKGTPVSKETVFFILQVGTGIGILLVGLVLACRYGYKKYSFNRMTTRLAVLYLYEVYLKKLAQKNMSIKAGETPSQYAQKIDELLMLEPISFEEITEIFLRARYSDLPITEEEKEKMKNFGKPLFKKLNRYKVKMTP